MQTSIWRTVIGCLALVTVACDRQTPVTPDQTPTTPTANRPPSIVTTVTPSWGVDDLTTFTARVEVLDPDLDRVTLSASGCGSSGETPVPVAGGVALLSFRTSWRCGSFVATATDERGATTRSVNQVEHVGLGGPLRLVIGEGFYSRPFFMVNLAQSGSRVTGGIIDLSHPVDARHGAIDPAEPGTIDEHGRFRLRFKIASEPGDLSLAGQLIAPRGGIFDDKLVGVGHVIGIRYEGRTFQLWHEAQY